MIYDVMLRRELMAVWAPGIFSQKRRFGSAGGEVIVASFGLLSWGLSSQASFKGLVFGCFF